MTPQEQVEQWIQEARGGGHEAIYRHLLRLSEELALAQQRIAALEAEKA